MISDTVSVWKTIWAEVDYPSDQDFSKFADSVIKYTRVVFNGLWFDQDSGKYYWEPDECPYLDTRRNSIKDNWGGVPYNCSLDYNINSFKQALWVWCSQYQDNWRQYPVWLGLVGGIDDTPWNSNWGQQHDVGWGLIYSPYNDSFDPHFSVVLVDTATAVAARWGYDTLHQILYGFWAAMHELGHQFGNLDECNDVNCLMTQTPPTESRLEYPHYCPSHVFKLRKGGSIRQFGGGQ
ncbi:hypothetical protein FJY70_02475 [candidate division WOR-3 bacterium]|nr:hypothetical protein [candidate division WOR-3 bacterium]